MGDSHRGIALGFDVSKGSFPRGCYPQGLTVNYVSDRTKMMLPVHAYYFKALRDWESRTLPHGQVWHEGMVVPEKVLKQQYEDAILQILQHKHVAWDYEAETRFLYDLRSVNKSGLTRESVTLDNSNTVEKDVVKFWDDCVAEIRLGCYCPPSEVENLFKLLCAGRFLNARLYISKPHRCEFKVEFCEVSKNELVNYYTLSKPGTWRGRPR